MEIDYLKEFVKLAEVGNYLEASEQLFISQSSLSKHIQSLEEELKVQLFDRTTRKTELSEFGKLFLPYAQKIVESEEEGKEAIEKKIDSNSRNFPLGIIPSIDSYGISGILAAFVKNRFGYKVKLIEEDTSVLRELLHEGKVTMAFAYDFGEKDKDIVSIPVLTDHLVVVCSRSHPSFAKEPISIGDLKGKKIMLLEAHTVLKRLTFQACQKAGFTPQVINTERRFLSTYDLDSSESLAIFFRQDATYINNPGNRIIEIVPEVKATMSLCYLATHKLTEEERYLIDCVKKNSAVKNK
jgi:LysR family transcriptional activator of glutamate synthase operon